MIFAFPLPPQIPNSHELQGAFAPQGPPPGASLDPLGTLAVPRPLACPWRPPLRKFLDPRLLYSGLVPSAKLNIASGCSFGICLAFTCNSIESSQSLHG